MNCGAAQLSLEAPLRHRVLHGVEIETALLAGAHFESYHVFRGYIQQYLYGVSLLDRSWSAFSFLLDLKPSCVFLSCCFAHPQLVS